MFNGPTDAPAPSFDPSAVEACARQIVGVMIRGLIASAQTVPHDVMLTAIARQTGNLLANSVAGDLGPIFALRKSLKDAFADGIQAAKPRAMGVPAQGMG